jgi:hypothetical protein
MFVLTSTWVSSSKLHVVRLVWRVELTEQNFIAASLKWTIHSLMKEVGPPFPDIWVPRSVPSTKRLAKV